MGEDAYISLFAPADCIEVQELAKDSKIQISYEPNRVFFLTYIGNFQFIVNDIVGSRNIRKGDLLTITQSAVGHSFVVSHVIRDGITGLAAAVEHRIANAGITRKISDRQVRCLNLVMTSDNEGMQRIIDSGKLDEWISDNIRWVRDTFGGDNVVGAAMHMDERTPHLHIAVVPIVTAERKKKAREATAKRRYRTKAANRPRLRHNGARKDEPLSGHLCRGNG